GVSTSTNRSASRQWFRRSERNANTSSGGACTRAAASTSAVRSSSTGATAPGGYLGGRRGSRRRRGGRGCEVRTESGDAEERVQHVVLRVHRKEPEDVLVVPEDESPNGHGDVDHTEHARVSACRIAERQQSGRSGDDVDHVVPAVHGQDPEHVLDVARGLEIRRV